MGIGIMQGRLLPPENERIQSFPRLRWQDEFASAAEAGLQFIEWIYDLDGVDVNPIASEDGIRSIRLLAAEFGVAVRSLCADYFMDCRDLDAPKLVWLLERCRLAGISRMVLPFVDATRIKDLSQADRVAAVVREVLQEAELSHVEIHLETSLDPQSFAHLLEAVPNPMCKVTYDSGNSASLGYSPAEEFAAYGKRIGSVHIKDRVRNGGTVRLGTGAADFATVMRELKKVSYSGDFVLQAARERPGEEVELARRNASWLLRQL
jgi:hexulose-6-phosphate isomerase